MARHGAPRCAVITVALIAGFSLVASGQSVPHCYSPLSCGQSLQPLLHCYSELSCAIASVYRVSARQVEAELPDMPLYGWLQRTAGPGADLATGSWENSWGSCEGIPSEANPPLDPNVPWRLCAQWAASLPDGRVVAIALSAQIVGSGTPQNVRFGSAYIIDTKYRYDSLDVHTLRELPAALEIAVDRWPHAELSVSADDVRLEPASPKPGERAEAVVTVRNTGADLARVRILLARSPECSDSSEPFATKEDKIPPGEALVWRQPFTAPPSPQGSLHVRAELLSVAHYIRKYESSPQPKEVSKPIGSGPLKNCSGDR
jgi:hypothetical protein